MSRIKEIRALLGNPSQAELAEALGCVQTNVSHYENGQRLPADRAAKLIAFAARKGLPLTLDQVYGLQPLPAPAEPQHDRTAGQEPAGADATS